MNYLRMGDIQVAYYDLNQETFEFGLDLNQDRDFAETLIEYPTEIIFKKCFQHLDATKKHPRP